MRSLLLALASAAAGLLLGWWLFAPDAPVPEPAAPAEQLPSGGEIIERDPAAKPSANIGTAAREAGGRLERVISVTVQPKPIPTPEAAGPRPAAPSTPEGSAPAVPASGCSCSPVTVDLGLVRMPDRTRRVVAVANGEIVRAIDIPIDMPPVVPQAKWAAGVSVSVDMSQRRAFGAFVDRDVGRVRIGLEISQRDGGTATLRAGIRF